MYTCRECEKPVNQASEVCPYCGADLSSPQDAQPTPPSSIIKRATVWGVMIAAVWLFLWFILPERSTGLAAQAEARALEAVETVRVALQAHVETSGSYPGNLDGLAADSFSRVRSAAQSAQTEGYRLDYAPGPAADGGNIKTFSLVAKPGRYGLRGFFLNETGVLRWTRDERPATAADPPLPAHK